MRKTLHTLPLQFAAAAHIATLRFRGRDAQRAILNGGYAPGTIDPLVAQLSTLLQDGPLPYRTIETLVAATGHDVQAVRLAIKIAWERGLIAYINATESWNREARTFALTASAYPELDLSLSRDHAVTTLITAYFHRYGPATIRDATWWSGLSASDVTAVLHRSGRALITVATPWSAQPCLMFADQATEALSSSALTGIRLLAHEDSALKAYYETRSRYLGGLPQRRAFNQIGEALPTIIIDGTVIGTWAWDTRSKSVSSRVLPGMATLAARRQISGQADSLTHTLRAGISDGSRQAT